jgi:hypothetical protein
MARIKAGAVVPARARIDLSDCCAKASYSLARLDWILRPREAFQRHGDPVKKALLPGWRFWIASLRSQGRGF